MDRVLIAVVTCLLTMQAMAIVPAAGKERKDIAWPVLKTYEGGFLRRVKMPIGGIGTGTVSLLGRGRSLTGKFAGGRERYS